MIKTYIFTAFILLSVTGLHAQLSLLQSGPMVGYSTMTEVSLWVQMNEESSVRFEYWDLEMPFEIMFTLEQRTLADNAHIAIFKIEHLDPGKRYGYQLYINGEIISSPNKQEFQTQELWQWRHDAPDFSFTTGSCAYVNEPDVDRPGTPYGSHYEIFKDIYDRNADFMLWLGDNTYLREVDWSSASGIQHRYTHTRSLPEMQAMLGSMHHYAIWDDHDFGTDNSDRSYPLKTITNKVFRLFFPSQNYIFKEGITSFFQWADCDFFLLDNRYNRTPNFRSDIKQHEILGDEQIQWLLDALVNSKASFKFISLGNPILNETAGKENYSLFAPQERLKLLQSIDELKIEGVIFLTGDIHYSEMTKLERPEAYPLYDLTISPLTSGLGAYSEDDNHQRVDGTLVREHNYAEFEVKGKRSERQMEISVFNSKGELKWNRIITANELRYK